LFQDNKQNIAGVLSKAEKIKILVMRIWKIGLIVKRLRVVNYYK